MQGAGSGMRAASSARKRGSSSSAPYKAPSRRAVSAATSPPCLPIASPLALLSACDCWQLHHPQSGPRVKPRPASANRSMPMATMALQVCLVATPHTAHWHTDTCSHARALPPSRSQFGEASAKPASRGMPRRKNGQALSPLPQRQGQHRAGMAHSKSTASMHRFRSAPRCLCQTTLPTMCCGY